MNQQRIEPQTEEVTFHFTFEVSDEALEAAGVTIAGWQYSANPYGTFMSQVCCD